MAARDDLLGWLPYRRIRVSGPSMAPTLFDGDVVLVRRGRVARVGDVVVVSWSARPGLLSIKRVIRKDPDGWFVTGDNTDASTDSRRFGPARIHGVVRWRLWPNPRRVR